MKLYYKYMCLGSLFALWLACNKPVTDLLDKAYTNEDTSSVQLSNPKVLYLVVDGLRGAAVNDLAPSNLSLLKRYSIYTYYALNNSSGINAIGLADMLTGVDSSKHKVKSSDFANNKFIDYPTLFTRIKTAHPDWRTVAYCRSQLLNDNALSDASEKSVMNSDADIASSIINELGSSKDPSLVFGEFGSVDSVGAANGYESNVTTYANAIQNVDQYIGNVLTALKARPNYQHENWLVVVASNKGGMIPYTPTIGMDSLDYANPVSNSFIYFYNPKFVSSYSSKPAMVPYSGTAPYFTTTSNYATVPNASDFDINATNEMTISLKIKIITQAYKANGGIIFKSQSTGNSNTGWWILHSNLGGTSTGIIRFALKGSGTYTLYSKTPLSTGEWHTITAKVFNNGGARYMQLYIDGVVDNATVAGSAPLAAPNSNCITTTPLRIGYNGNYYASGGYTASQLLSDIRIYNVALPDNIIAKYACQPYVDVADSYYSNLIGYWPGNDGSGLIITDQSPLRKNNMNITSSNGWTSFSDLSNYVCPKPSSDYFNLNPKGIDIPVEIYNWLGIRVLPSWNLDGKYWTPQLNTIR